MVKLKQMRRIAVLAALAVGQTVAMAQTVTITYGPDVASVPTLSEWSMIIMAAALAFVAVIAMRKGAGSKTVMSIALAAVVAFGGGTYALKEAMATPNGILMNNQAGGVITATQGGVTTPLINDTSVRLRVLSISAPAVHNVNGGCVAGVTVLAPNVSCTVLTDGNGPQGND